MEVNRYDKQRYAYRRSTHYSFLIKVDWGGYTRLLQDKRVSGDPRRSMRQGSFPTARGKRVPAAEINQQEKKKLYLRSSDII
jgi:hypothetical protein